MENLEVTLISRDDVEHPSGGFLPIVEEKWAGKSAIFSVELPDEEVDAADDEAWIKLGNALVSELLTLGKFVGACLDGDCPASTVVDWTGKVTSGSDIGVVNLKWCSYINPGNMAKNRLPNAQNVTWCVVQQASGATWVPGIWNVTGGSLFIGADLIIAVYAADLTKRFSRGNPLTLDSFIETLPRALAWIIPLDGGGFYLGLPRTSGLYKQLTQKTRD
ncbi:MAG: hypothetical protein NVSMB52_07650 [Chloroflexota bacterium]